MTYKRLLNKNQEVIKKWELFVRENILDAGSIRSVIAESWVRCKGYAIDPYDGSKLVQLTEQELKKKYDEFMPLLVTAKPFMGSLYKIIENSEFVIRLTDREGYVLEHIGEEHLIKIYNPLSLGDGYNIREEITGTNAIGISLITGEPIQVVGGEHYIKQYHEWTSSACPIKDEQGNILGVLSITGSYEQVHPHTLGMVVAAAEAIEKELKLENSNRRLKLINERFYQITESISEGIVAIDQSGMIINMNRFARKLLGYGEKEAAGKYIKDIIAEGNKENIINDISHGIKYEEEEINLKGKNGRKKICIANITPIKIISNKELIGCVITFREKRVVHSLVNKIVGANARFTFDDILGKSQAIRHAKRMAKIAATMDATILLLGESGTGKEMFAQAIHNDSKRRDYPFVFLNCGAIPRDLVSSELFGYEEGAFTGSIKGGRAGKFELADGGTIFLDEIGDMPLDSQAHLLRVLEDHKVVRIGGHDIIPVDVRVIAATNKDLSREVEIGNFRRDLYYRLNVMPISTPNLRDRKEDIDLLVDYFIKKFCVTTGKSIKKISDSFYGVMNSYDWPGNVRELQNAIQLILNIAEDNSTLTDNDIPNNYKYSIKTDGFKIKGRLLTLDEIEKQAIEKTIEETEGNLRMTAKILGIGRSTLYRKMKKYNINIEYVLT
ncbi:acetoin dehydrogenase operon transcriptional activator AcoR [Oxobacter pfennigii]|uniref:Acetoin dehydrogenase operon transcriptional activator AcoR n=1 Tax=Oxobacter pfennigii TaxID=36849 RepID=A0A0P8WVN1_9CLOT|nr:sigma 54-interacting transcriptional regulator [Oxobacter pfennigii]KPU42308.1 acetoin dehydrogenase operon transcriptional activator AcoR [Oxobacter pfennigii]